MATLASLVREVIGETPTDRTLWRYIKSRGSNIALAEVLERYLDAELEPLPGKSGTALRPAYISDYVGEQTTPYDREFNFVAQALCYSEGVAVVDELEAYPDPDRVRAGNTDLSLGFRDCDNASWILRRIVRYAQLEEASVLYYAPTPQVRNREAANDFLTDEACRTLAPQVASRLGWKQLPALGDETYSLSLVRHQLTMCFTELFRCLDYASALDGAVDLYLSDWFAGPELLGWLEGQRGDITSYSADQRLQTSTLNRLTSLPAPASDTLINAGAKELLALRASDQMESWRHDLDVLLRDFTKLNHTDEDVRLLDRELHSRLEKHQQAVTGSTSLRGSMIQAVNLGIATASMALLMGQPPASTALLAAGSGAIASLLDYTKDWMTGSAPDALEANHKARNSAVRLFLSDPKPATAADPLPRDWLVDAEGRPVSFGNF